MKATADSKLVIEPFQFIFIINMLKFWILSNLPVSNHLLSFKHIHGNGSKRVGFI